MPQTTTSTSFAAARGGFADVRALAFYTLREALKNRITWIAGVFSVIGVAFAGFAGDVALTESEQIQTAFLAAGYRVCAVLVILFFVSSTLVREFNDKCLELYLSLPITRASYYFGKLAGFVACGAILAAVFGAALLFHSKVLLTAGAETASILAWTAALACELALMAAVAIFCVMTFNQQLTPALVVALFLYFLARAWDAIVLISYSEIIIPTAENLLIRKIIEWMFLFLPRLSQFAQTEWLIYGDSPNLLFVFLQTAVFGGLVAAATLFDFTRKNL